MSSTVRVRASSNLSVIFTFSLFSRFRLLLATSSTSGGHFEKATPGESINQPPANLVVPMEEMSSEMGKPKGKTRLMITKMILENFKSYAGAQEIGPFHKRFSSVVGPNGSGKSNVIDALLFVFGKRAKQLRLNKVAELIHKSSGFPNLEYAKVSVHFQLIYDDEESADDFEVVPGSEFIVSRTADLKSQSKYSVDGKGSTYTEVGLLLRKHGIDLDNNRFLILQGEVEQIAMMKPKAQSEHEEGLLEYLEDIIGSNTFVPQIEEVFVRRKGKIIFLRFQISIEYFKHKGPFVSCRLVRHSKY